MVQFAVDSMLGPYGKMISNWYIANQMMVNTVVIAIGLFRLFKRRNQSSAAEANEPTRTS
ncbi:hypothetical protein GCM10011571_07070 [Marinithermofilum abyssi]|jgi:hypothetical protein|uniref:Uncharacterized protein n=1 Tax=Marinithermofilum abyssi TaxID=1571185 RepID=A0A8J2YDA5_9BACL|nr:hypothetical protein [Marinithermofilum abyssi]GGE08371.1 hypothetical protein GCM10011571_07070 [Marinithermofilum abyssi]